MSDRVDSNKIEGIVGVKRHAAHHYARASSIEQTVYVLHSQTCFDRLPDLDCAYTLALDSGIDPEEWAGFEDRPVRVMVSYGCLVPYDFYVHELEKPTVRELGIPADE